MRDQAGQLSTGQAETVLRLNAPRTTAPRLGRIRQEIRRSNKWAYVFIAPLILDFLVFTVYMVIRVAAMSFQDISYGQVDWVGLQHFQEVLNDAQFWNAMKNTVVYTLAVVPGAI